MAKQIRPIGRIYGVPKWVPIPLMLLTASFSFGATTAKSDIKAAGLENAANEVMKFMTDPWVGLVLGVIFLLALLGWMLDKQDDQFKQNAMRVMIVAGVLASASTITGVITDTMGALV